MVFGGFAYFSRGARRNVAFLRLNLGSTPVAPLRQRVGGSKGFSSSICGRFVPSLNYPKRFDSWSRYYTSSSSTNGNKSPPKSWRSFLIPGSAILGIGGFASLFHSNDKGRGEKSEIDAESRSVTKKKKWVLLYFDYASSHDAQKLEAKKLHDTVKLLESKQIKIVPLFVTRNPCPDDLFKYLLAFSEVYAIGMSLGELRRRSRKFVSLTQLWSIKFDEGSDDIEESPDYNMYLLNPSWEVERAFVVDCEAHELAEAIAEELRKGADPV